LQTTLTEHPFDRRTSGVTLPRSIPYRRDIDALRAIAVTMVILFHLGSSWISGGYIGVDIFFVISGYLITSILNTERDLSWSALGSFYTRRFKRLAPAFVVVGATTALCATYLLLPEDLNHFIQSLRESIGFSANDFFEHETTGYFASNASQLPWLHTWSLSVEWQFYFAFPFVFWFLTYFEKSPSRRAWLMSAVTAVALAVSVHMTDTSLSHAYFSALSRFFEFSIGAVAAIGGRPAIRARLAQFVSLACVLGLIFLSTFFVKETTFPGWNAFAVCALVTALLFVGRVSSVLSVGWLAVVGKRSYSAYLWHWPLIAFLNYVQRTLTFSEVAALIALMALLSELTYRFVERPGVKSTGGLPQTVAIWFLIPFLVTSSAYFISRRNGGFPGRLGREAAHAYSNLRRYSALSGDTCHNYLGADLNRCVLGDSHSAVQALLIGDSHAKSYSAFVDLLARNAQIKVIGLTASECLTLQGASVPKYTAPKICQASITRDYALIASRQYKFVLMAERWIGYPRDQLRKLGESIGVIVASGAVPVILKPIAEDGENTKDCFYRHIKLRQARTEKCSIPVDTDFQIDNRRFVNSLIDQVSRKYPTLIVIDPQAVECESGVCQTIIDNTPIYSDSHHLNEFGANALAREYLARFGNPLVPSARLHISP